MSICCFDALSHCEMHGFGLFKKTDLQLFAKKMMDVHDLTIELQEKII
jgi:hypothetical protein